MLFVLDVLVSLLGAYSALLRLVFMKRGQTWTTNQPSANAMSTIPLDLAETDFTRYTLENENIDTQKILINNSWKKILFQTNPLF